MKRYTTRFFKTVAWLYVAFPVLYLSVVAVIFDVPASSLVRILLSPLFYLVSIMGVVTGYGLLEMKRWSWYLLVATDLLALYVSALILNDYGEAHHKLLAFLAVAGATFLAAYRLGREIRVPYFFPKIAWWESDPRYRISVPVKIILGSGEEIAGEILDLSLGGCFVKTRVDVGQDQKATLEFSVFGYSVRCEGMIVWKTQSTVTHPKGIGIKFRSLERVQRRHLRIVTRRLKRSTQVAKRERYLVNQDGFLRNLHDKSP